MSGPELDDVLSRLRELAIQYYALTGKPLGVARTWATQTEAACHPPHLLLAAYLTRVSRLAET